MNSLPSIKDLSLSQLSEAVKEMGQPQFRAKQISVWLYHKGASSFSQMTNISKELHAELGKRFVLTNPDVVKEQCSVDGTRKFALRLADGHVVECVIILDEKRRTLCMSTQAGCKRNCLICATGKMGFKRSLTQGEILDQLVLANRILGEENRITNIVFMGMGEPMDNLEALLPALEIIHDDNGFCVSPKRVTISTVGVIEGIERLAKEGFGEGLAISLHASSDEVRQTLIPFARKVSITEIIEASKMYAQKTAEKVTFEYVVIKGVNSSPEDGKRLAKLLSKLPSKINLIPYNPVAGLDFESPSDAEMAAFKQPILDSPVLVTVRKSRGRDIDAACGQLAAKIESN